jgi:hypothetical protein
MIAPSLASLRRSRTPAAPYYAEYRHTDLLRERRVGFDLEWADQLKLGDPGGWRDDELDALSLQVLGEAMLDERSRCTVIHHPVEVHNGIRMDQIAHLAGIETANERPTPSFDGGEVHEHISLMGAFLKRPDGEALESRARSVFMNLESRLARKNDKQETRQPTVSPGEFDEGRHRCKTDGHE